jgi:uncharacterized membrane protein
MNTLLQLAQSSYDYTYTTTSTNVDPATAGALAAGLLFAYFAVIIIAYVVSALLLGRIFKKAGVKSWIAWVPLYNSWKLFEIGGQQGFWAILSLVPVVNIVSLVFGIIAYYNIGLKLGKSAAFVAWVIFLPIVWLVWLAMDKSVWNDSLGAPSRAVEHTSAAPVAAAPATVTPAEAPASTENTPPTTPTV